MLYFCAMRKCFLLILLVALFSCSRKEASMLDAVPLDAEIIVESADSAVIMLFDSLLNAHIDKAMVVNGKIASVGRVLRPAEIQGIIDGSCK